MTIYRYWLLDVEGKRSRPLVACPQCGNDLLRGSEDGHSGVCIEPRGPMETYSYLDANGFVLDETMNIYNGPEAAVLCGKCGEPLNDAECVGEEIS